MLNNLLVYGCLSLQINPNVLRVLYRSIWFYFLQDPRHLQLHVQLNDVDIYQVMNARKKHHAPSEFSFCTKVSLSSPTVQPLSTKSSSPSSEININVPVNLWLYNPAKYYSN